MPESVTNAPAQKAARITPDFRTIFVFPTLSIGPLGPSSQTIVALQQKPSGAPIVADRHLQFDVMIPRLSSPRFFNPLMLWADVGLRIGEMLVSSSSVIQRRTQLMAQAGIAPSAADIEEMQLMSHEKLEAVTESGAAIANQLHTTQYALVNRAVQAWFGGASALVGIATSTSPDQVLSHGNQWISAATRGAATASQLSSASARIAQRGLRPIHAKATSNARRLAQSAA